MNEQNLPPNILKIQKFSVSDIDAINDNLDHRLFPKMNRFEKFFAAQWHDIKGNAKWCAFLLFFSIAIGIYKLFKPFGNMIAVIIVAFYFVFVAILLWIYYRKWCKREGAKIRAAAATSQSQANGEHKQKMRKIQNDWLKYGRHGKTPPP